MGDLVLINKNRDKHEMSSFFWHACFSTKDKEQAWGDAQ